LEHPAITAIAVNMNLAGVPEDYGPAMSRLLKHIWKEVAKGKPITQARVNEIIEELGVSPTEASAFLDNKAEHDAGDDIVGILGLSQDPAWAHRFTIDEVELRTWCAWDPLFLVQFLDKKAKVKSACTVTGRPVEVFLSPGRVERYTPSTAVISMVTLDPKRHDRNRLEELWSGL
jgi:alkylmercury lyase